MITRHDEKIWKQVIVLWLANSVKEVGVEGQRKQLEFLSDALCPCPI